MFSKLKNMRFRHVYMFFGGLFTLVAWTITDPELGLIQNLPIGASTVSLLVFLLKSILFVGMLHYSAKALIDYVDKEELFNKAKETPLGAALALVAVALIMISISIVIMAATMSG